MFDIETKIGNIHFSSNIINKIAEKAVEDCGGKVMLHNYKGALMDVMPGWASKMNLYDESAASVEVLEIVDGYIMTIYVVIKFGTSIKEVTSQILDSIYENSEKILGQKPKHVKVVVTGVVSKNIAKRHIEVSR